MAQRKTSRSTQTEGKVRPSAEAHFATEHKKADTALTLAKKLAQDEKDKFQALLEISPSGIIILEQPDGHVSFANERARELYGLDVTGLSLGEHTQAGLLRLDGTPYPPEEMPASRSLLRGEVVRGEVLIIARPDGARLTVAVHSAPLKDANGKIRSAIGIFNDVTAQRNAQAALRESEARAQALIKYAPTGIYEIDYTVPRITSINDAMCTLSGYSREELLTINPTDILDDDSKKLFASRIRRQLAGEKIDDAVDFKVRKKDGSIIDVALNIAFSREKPHTALVIGYDVTERKKAAQFLARAKEELETAVEERTKQLAEANEQLKQYAYRLMRAQEEERKRIAYELHDDTAQYLSILKMQIGSLLHSGKVQDEEVLMKLRYLEEDAQRAFDDIRHYSHELRPSMLEDLGLQAALEQIAGDINKLDGFKIQIDATGTEPFLSEDVRLGLFRITQEALNNARKHSGARNATVSLEFRDKLIDMTITDNGAGFDIDQATAAARRKGSLGLISMRERAYLLGAGLIIQSRPGQGTVVKVQMPL